MLLVAVPLVLLQQGAMVAHDRLQGAMEVATEQLRLVRVLPAGLLLLLGPHRPRAMVSSDMRRTDPGVCVVGSVPCT